MDSIRSLFFSFSYVSCLQNDWSSSGYYFFSRLGITREDKISVVTHVMASTVDIFLIDECKRREEVVMR